MTTIFQKNKINWKAVVDDRTYIRRVYLDVIGLLPTPQQIDTFAADQKPHKRETLVKELLNRDNDYAQHWLTFWNDALSERLLWNGLHYWWST